MTPAPAYWTLLCTRFLQTSPRLAAELWRAYVALDPPRSTTTRYALDTLLAQSTLATFQQRLQHLDTLLPPKALMAASTRLSPEGRCRRRDVVACETTLLRYVDRHGNWR